MKVGIIRVSYNCLEQMLCLPDGVHIERVSEDPNSRLRVFEVRVCGDSLPEVREGELISFVEHRV